ncbi:helix-turn-helix domain-containing protein [Noviherbaspirillum saxi]|uniref:AraC family transcriptional regulator n=1 Tax=Noviherbaspirillum saxi TaxID=2320863 RepID=A0A3A3FNP8_9BURK|nr:AraC family transcriptional regulator [Noviherbaspirillum saxi]RJF95072.1 AraC family transcriptional regulator [Noviherbaspirillum saxi]
MSIQQISALPNSPIQVMVEGKLVQLDEATKCAESVTPQPAQPWHGFPIEFLSGKAKSDQLPSMYHPDVFLWHGKVGCGMSRMTSGCYTYDAVTGPGDTLFVQENFEIDRSSFQTTDFAGIALAIRPAELNLLFPEEIKTLSLSGFQITKDKALDNLLSLMEMEIRNGCPSGRLYAESLSIALVTYLTQTYANGKPLKSIGNKLAGQNLQKVKSYVRENLANELSLHKLASLVNLSPYHFARLFKATIGMAPHSYVTEQRIQEAQRLLKSDRTIAEIAAVTGFASQAHMSDVFRRRFGVPPIKLRKQWNHS